MDNGRNYELCFFFLLRTVGFVMLRTFQLCFTTDPNVVDLWPYNVCTFCQKKKEKKR